MPYSGGEYARQVATAFTGNKGGTTINLTVIVQIADAATKDSGAVTGAITGGVSNYVKGVCFVAGTSVLASAGYVLIEDVSVGDKVWSENPETGEKD